MDLSRNIIKKYVEVATPVEVTENDKTVYGTIVGEGDELYVKLDGSDALTPISSSIDVRDGDRVLVLIKNHEAMVLGSPTSPTARLEELRALEGDVTEFGVILADKVGVGELVAMQATIDELTASDVEITGKLEANEAKIETLEAENVTINGKLDVYQADIEELEANKIDATEVEAKYATIGSLEATDAKVTNLEASYGEFSSATIERLDAYEAEIENLDATYATITQLDVEKGRITDLEATRLTAESAEIKNLQADVADIDTLIFGSASGTTIQSSFANAVIAQLGNAQIKSAMIDSVSADKITAGDILTNNVRILSEDGKLLISDETIQISDDTRVRVQIGKDASNDYSINVWDASGKLMFSQGGITDAAIKDAIIRNDMVANDANIAASKLDISSLFTEINNSTETINSNKVLIDTDAGTLDVAFTKMSSDIDDISDDVTSQGTAISVIQGQISSKIWMDDITTVDLSEIEGSITTLESQYSELDQTVDGISATVGQHTTQIANKADSSTVTTVSDRVTEVEADLEGFRTSVSETYATKTALSATDAKASNAATAADSATTLANNAQKAADAVQEDVNLLETRVSTAETSITQNAEAIELRATKTELTTVSNAASAAQSTANAANTAAANAQTAADDAQDAADEAQSGVIALQSRMSSAETSINQNADAIALRATKTELTTVSNAADNAQKAADDAQDTADSIETDLANNYYTKTQTDAQIKVSADAITSTVETLETTLSENYSTTSEMNSAIEQKAGEITQTVSSTYATKTALSATDTKAVNAATAASNAQKAADDAQDAADQAQTEVDAVETRMTNAETRITQTETDISLRATKTELTTVSNAAVTAQSTADAASTAAANAQSDIDNLEIGGRNLVLDSAIFSEAKDDTHAYLPTIRPKISSYGVTALQTAETVTISFDYEVPEGSTGVVRVAIRSTSNGSHESAKMLPTPSWPDVSVNPTGHFSFTINVAEDHRLYGTQFLISAPGVAAGETVNLRNFKMEVGDKATDWTPAPEDFDSDISELRTTFSELILGENGISASVNSITKTMNDKFDEYDGAVSDLKKSVDATITSDQVQLQIKNELSNGVSKVTTETGFTFDSDGLKVTKSDSEMETSITENGMTVSRSGEEVLRADNEGVKAEDLHATTYLIIGENSRFEDYTFNGEARTGCFWIGPTNA